MTLALIACTRSSTGTVDAATSVESKTATPPVAVGAIRRLVVSKNTARVGTLTFDKSTHQVTLVTEGAGPAADELKRAWKEIASMPKVSWTKTVVEGTGTSKVTASESEEYSSTDDNYPHAVLDTLSRRYGFPADIER